MTYHNQRPQCPSLSPHVLLNVSIYRIHNGGLKTLERGWTAMSILKALMQNCKMANGTSNFTAVVLTEDDIPGAA